MTAEPGVARPRMASEPPQQIIRSPLTSAMPLRLPLASPSLTFIDHNLTASPVEPSARENAVIIKAKRRRISPEQLEILCALFEQTESPSYSARDEVGAKVGMTNREVQVWFQNRRARKARLESLGRHEEIHAVSTAGSADSSNRSRSPREDGHQAQVFAFRIPGPIQPRRTKPSESPMPPSPSGFARYPDAYHESRSMPRMAPPPFAYPYANLPRYYAPPSAYSPASPVGYPYSPPIPSPALSTSSSASRQTLPSPFTPATSVANLSPSVHLTDLSLREEGQDYFASKGKASPHESHLPPMRRPSHKRCLSDTTAMVGGPVRLPSLHHILDGPQPGPAWSQAPSPRVCYQHSPVPLSPGSHARPSWQSLSTALPTNFGPVRRVSHLRHQHSLDSKLPHYQPLHYRPYAALPVLSRARDAERPAQTILQPQPVRRITTGEGADSVEDAPLGLGFIKDEGVPSEEDEEEARKAAAYRRMSIDHHSTGLMRSAAAVSGPAGKSTATET